MEMDNLVGTALGATEDVLDTNDNVETSFGSAALRFVISIFWVLITTLCFFVGAFAMVMGNASSFFGGSHTGLLYGTGIGMCLIVAVTTGLVPYLRKKGTLTRRCGIVALGEAIWFLYLAITF